MKYIKKIIFICLIFALAGCSVEYNVNINEDNSISEKVIASENTNKLQAMTRKKGDNAVNYIYQMYKRDDDIDITTTDDNDTTTSTLVTSYKDIEEYANKATSDIFDNPIVTRKDKKVTLTINQTEPLSKDSSYSYIYDNITIKINVPFEVIDNNADEISGNDYIWYITKDSTLNTIKLVYNEDSLKDNFNIKINDKVFNINYLIIVLGSLALLILIIVFIVIYNNKKNNLV